VFYIEQYDLFKKIWKRKNMAKIKIIPAAKKPSIPNSNELNREIDRFQAPGGKPGLPMGKAYNRQGGNSKI
jgi:hypothetical protein